MIIRISEMEMETLRKAKNDIIVSLVENNLESKCNDDKFIDELITAEPGKVWKGKTGKITKVKREDGKVFYNIYVQKTYVCDMIDTTTSITLPLLPIIGTFVKSMKAYTEQVKGIMDSFRRRHS